MLEKYQSDRPLVKQNLALKLNMYQCFLARLVESLKNT